MIIDCHNHLGVDLFFYLNGFHPYAQDLPAMVTEGRHGGVDRWVVFPMVSHLGFDVDGMRRGELNPATDGSVPYAFENERMLEEIYERYPALGRLTLPFAILDPLREPAAQLRVLRRLHAKYPFFGLKIQATIIKSDVLALLDAGRGFLEFAKEFNLPFIIHSSVAPEDTWSQASSILRVAEATPNVRFCLAHSCRFDRECLDRVAALPNTWFDCSAHRIHCDSVRLGLPNVAPAARRFHADYHNPTAVLHDLASAYPTKMMWGSDSPFQSYVDDDFALRSTYADETACLHALPADLKKAVAHDNLLALLQINDERLLA
ncbi:amidohydrolase family protein [Synoicihabitans lomoniglobus]|uniref:Amidohydrolase family protein n=1 Tax=Synoicihabitans lomoniglobus TaxID=2909285 RepID=A0AAE9ZUS7_9BACT|nr:amidohydrolase [Opitutaceae bacterium LMO-M01]WED63716.1 amidohydrolase family protein [Opitutaceae bacterium LMO-M01]